MIEGTATPFCPREDMPAAGVEPIARSHGMAVPTRTIRDFSDTGVEVSDPCGVRERLRGTFTGVADESDGGCLTGKVLTLPPSRDLPEPRYLRHGEGGDRTPGALGDARASGRGKVRYPRIVRGRSRGSRRPPGASRTRGFSQWR